MTKTITDAQLAKGYEQAKVALMTTTIHIGVRVRERDGRHVGLVEAITFNSAKVRWEGNNWISWCPLETLVRTLIWDRELGRHREEDQ